MIDKVKDFIKECLENKGEVENMVLEHLLATEKYVSFLYKEITGKEAPEELRIAALGHDIERAFRDMNVYKKMYKSDKGFLDKEFLEYHQRKSAEIIADFLKTNNYPREKIEKVYNLIINHEFGGDFDTDILKDADSISFFIHNVEHFVKVKSKESSIEKVKEKLNWMFNRITNKQAKNIVISIYKK